MKLGGLEIVLIAAVIIVVVAVIVVVVVLASRRSSASQHQQATLGGAARFCPNCGSPLHVGANFCMQCGAPIKPADGQIPSAPTGSGYADVTTSAKSAGVTVALAIVPAFFGFYGIGQMYAERIGRGLAILLADWVVTGVGIAVLISGFSNEDSGLVMLAVVLGLASLALFIWQIVDAASLVSQWNRRVAQTGQRPW